MDSRTYYDGLSTGNKNVLENIYQELSPKFKAYVLKNGGKAVDAKDMFQEGLIIVLTKLRKNQIKDQSNFKGYLFTVCRNIWLNKINRERVIFDDNSVLKNEGQTDEVLFEDEEGNMELLAEDVVREMNKRALFKKGLAQLSQGCKDLIILKLKGLSYDKIKEMLGFNTKGNVGKKLHDCKEHLKKIIRGDVEYDAIFVP